MEACPRSLQCLQSIQSCAILRIFSCAGACTNRSAASSMSYPIEAKSVASCRGNVGAQSAIQTSLRKAMYNGKILTQSERPSASNVGRFQSHQKSAPKFSSMFQAILDCTPTTLSAHAIGGGVSLQKLTCKVQSDMHLQCNEKLLQTQWKNSCSKTLNSHTLLSLFFLFKLKLPRRWRNSCPTRSRFLRFLKSDLTCNVKQFLFGFSGLDEHLSLRAGLPTQVTTLLSESRF